MPTAGLCLRFFCLQVGVQLGDGLGGAVVGGVVVNAEHHLLIGVAEPEDGELHVDAGVAEHGAVGVPQVVRTDVHGPVLA